jgi:hypothetical protein
MISFVPMTLKYVPYIYVQTMLRAEDFSQNRLYLKAHEKGPQTCWRIFSSSSFYWTAPEIAFAYGGKARPQSKGPPPSVPS